jgi:methionyl-tRNA formyltransferase
MNAARPQPAFVVVGRGTLALGCCRLLAERGLPVRAVVSDDPALGQWARRAGARHLALAADLAGLRWEGVAPVLLSIGNEQLIAPAVLQRFAHAFNFHDGPLPRYAGSHVTSWALMARVRRYAVSWHRMTAHADAGDIVLQAEVPLTADETALSLNAKCHDIALKSFASLAQRLAAQAYDGQPQRLAGRTFYPRDRKADDLAILDWTRGADDLCALVRALAFGPYVNRLGLPKVRLPSAFVGLRSLGVCASRSTQAPGTLVSITQDALTVATTTHNVRLRDFVTLDGCETSPAQLAGTFGLREDDVLPPIDRAATSRAIEQACGWKEEAAWMNDLRSLKPLDLPLAAAASDRAVGTDVVLPALEHGMPGMSHDAGDFTFALLLVCLGRRAGVQTFDVGLCCAPAGMRTSGIEALLADTRPFRVDLDLDEPFESFLRGCRCRLDAWRARKAFLRDAVVRYPGVARPPGWADFSAWPVSIDLGGDAATARAVALSSASNVRFVIARASGQVRVVHGGIASAQVDRFAAQLGALAEDCVARPRAALGDLALLPAADRATLLAALGLQPLSARDSSRRCM